MIPLYLRQRITRIVTDRDQRTEVLHAIEPLAADRDETVARLGAATKRLRDLEACLSELLGVACATITENGIDPETFFTVKDAKRLLKIEGDKS